MIAITPNVRRLSDAVGKSAQTFNQPIKALTA
jgi:hypothetical protein